MCVQVYFCVAVFKFLEKSILKHVQEQNLLVFLKASEPLVTQCAVMVWSGAWCGCGVGSVVQTCHSASLQRQQGCHAVVTYTYLH